MLARRLEPRGVFCRRFALGVRNALGKVITLLDLAYSFGHRLGARDVVKDFPQLPLGNARRAVHQTLDLLLDAIAELFGVEVSG